MVIAEVTPVIGNWTVFEPLDVSNINTSAEGSAVACATFSLETCVTETLTKIKTTDTKYLYNLAIAVRGWINEP